MGVPPGSTQRKRCWKAERRNAIKHLQWNNTTSLTYLRTKPVTPLPFAQGNSFPDVVRNCCTGRKAPDAKDADAAKLRNLLDSNIGPALILLHAKQTYSQTVALSV